MKKYFKLKFIIIGAIIFGLLSLVAIITCDHLVKTESDRLVYTDASKLPSKKVGLVLGCAKLAKNGKENLFFKYRIAAALKVYNAGKVEFIIVSGDNSRSTYDEPNDMRNELIKKGIPANKIVCDYAGFRTLDSVVRTDKVFQEKSFIIISQEFHVKRAVYIGQAKGLDVVGYCAQGVSFRYSIKTKLREYLARVKVVLDLHIFNTKPRFLGPKIDIERLANKTNLSP